MGEEAGGFSRGDSSCGHVPSWSSHRSGFRCGAGTFRAVVCCARGLRRRRFGRGRRRCTASSLASGILIPWSSPARRSRASLVASRLSVLIAQISELVDGAGNTTTRHLDLYCQAVSAIYPQSTDEGRLIEAARLGLKIAQNKVSETDAFEDELPWIYDYFVNHYFC